MDFKIGDRVFLLPGWTAGCDNKFRETAKTGETGEIVFLNSRGQVGICFDRDVGGHDLSGGCPRGRGQWVSIKYISPVLEKYEITIIEGSEYC